MTRLWMATLAWACLAGIPASAQDPALRDEIETRLNAAPDPTLTPVESLTCDQMSAEMIVAGQRMSSQLDPSFATDAQALQDDSQRAMRQSMGAAMGAGVMCSVPGLGLACGAIMQANAANMAAQAQSNRDRMDGLTNQVAEATDGIDLARMSALSDRFEAEDCQMPEGVQDGMQ